MNRLCLALVVLLLLGACSVSRPPPEKTLALYDFGPAPTSSVVTGGAALGLEVRLSSWLDVTAMQYRLAYRDAARLQEYAWSRWAIQPSQLLQQRLSVLLGLQAQSACVLRVDVREFVQSFSDPAHSRAHLQGEVRILSAGREQLAVRPFAIEIATDTPDAPGGVRAMVAATDELARQLREWTQNLPGGEGIQSCRLAPAKEGK